MNHWTRAAANDLARTAMQAGLDVDDAEQALVLGARMLAHGFTSQEINDMVQHAYRARLEYR